jgi:hypothetical protein
MPKDEPTKHPKTGIRQPRGRRNDKRAEEVLRDQTKTEVEERPYLDTEGGE